MLATKPDIDNLYLRHIGAAFWAALVAVAVTFTTAQRIMLATMPE
jgi:hypothetical protein